VTNVSEADLNASTVSDVCEIFGVKTVDRLVPCAEKIEQVLRCVPKLETLLRDIVAIVHPDLQKEGRGSPVAGDKLDKLPETVEGLVSLQTATCELLRLPGGTEPL
jgi:hypothetical protein